MTNKQDGNVPNFGQVLHVVLAFVSVACDWSTQNADYAYGLDQSVLHLGLFDIQFRLPY